MFALKHIACALSLLHFLCLCVLLIHNVLLICKIVYNRMTKRIQTDMADVSLVHLYFGSSEPKVNVSFSDHLLSVRLSVHF